MSPALALSDARIDSTCCCTVPHQYHLFYLSTSL
jgi:hypothetical protein